MKSTENQFGHNLENATNQAFIDLSWLLDIQQSGLSIPWGLSDFWLQPKNHSLQDISPQDIVADNFVLDYCR